MKKKPMLLLFIVACFIICIIPSAGMLFFSSDETISNEDAFEFPPLVNEDNTFNQDIFEQLGTYFEKHFAFRPYVISLDAQIQSKVFKVSNLDTVIVGKDDWLYYSSTLNDYLGKNTLSDRAINNIAHNLKLTQDYVNSQGIDFLFTVAPNKNSVYDEYMPYYYGIPVSDRRNVDVLKTQLDEKGVNYCDLYPIFEESDEILYLQQDSHWNDKGAKLVYDKILTKLSKMPRDYSDTNVVRTKNFMGDLGKMLYPKTQESEYNYDYSEGFDFTYTTDTKSVEDAIIGTKSDRASGSLYMYRDSFGNSLLPFFASSYNKAYFTKTFPLNLSIDLLVQKPDTVIIELVERNLNWLLTQPPVFLSPELTSYSIVDKMDCNVDVTAKTSQVNMTYIELSGTLSEDIITDNCKIYVKLTDNSGASHLFEAFHTSTDTSDYGFTAYVNAADYNSEKLSVSVVAYSDTSFKEIGSSTIKVEEVTY
ncbi:MAG: hypothetical protein E7513_03270 [Ruminococcaceae bacterium]|nr:hypothetical protein [Oscillospiraceae bacterium]